MEIGLSQVSTFILYLIFNTTTGVTSSGYLGCYFDEHPARRLTGDFKDFGKDHTQKTCIDYCKGKGYKYAGIQSSTQCFCGDQKPTSDDSRPESQCNSKCTGDESQICGGDWRNSIYETDVGGESNSGHLGCYLDESPARRLIGDFKDFGKYHTQKTCIDYCKGKGYVYAGVQASTQCFCGDQKPTSDDSRPESQCNSKCTGDESQICGGSWRNSIYETRAGVTSSGYLGCYFDEHPGRRLTGGSKDFGEYHTQKTCIDYCKGKGYKYAGVQASTQCYCGDHKPTSVDSRPESQCNSKCTGDESQICGGAWRNSIYETGVAGKSNSGHLGCYLDESPARRLIGDFKDFGKYHTQKTCIDYCKGKGYVYAGVQASTQCFCGDHKPTSDDSRPESQCNSKCTGDESQICGGDWRNSIYKTGVAGVTNSGYLGCYFDEHPARRLTGDTKDFGKYHTQKTCIDYCKGKGYKYAGVQASTQCYCGDHKPTSVDSRPESQCNSKCTGDESQICGGDWRNSIYETGVAGESNSGYLGCYLDESPARRLIGDFKDFGKYHTQKTCIDYCKGKGYVYAGVQASTQCFCGDQKPTSDDSRPESQCNSKCTGDESQICGGSWRNSIYETRAGVTNSGYLGCYIDEHPARRLTGDTKDFGKYHTQKTCIDYCEGKGYKYAGVQASTQCYCGDHKPTSVDSRPESQCNSKCTGDESQICGGAWRNSIYETGVAGESNSGYLGCYLDESPARRLIGDFKDFGKYHTQKTCINYCKGKGYVYAGVQASTQCYCGDHKPTSVDSRPENQCNSKCTGDESQICGGDWRNSIYETGVADGSNSGYLGCYLDESPARRLIGDFKDFGKYHTQKTCIDYCKGKGYKYAGVQSSTQCFCGDHKPTSDDSRPESQCNSKCTGDESQICGGDWRNSIYETDVGGGTSSVYLGCYFDESPARRLIGDFRDFGKYLTQKTCIDYCKDKGYKYAGVQSSTQCFCGDHKPTSDDSRPETECSYKCTGDQSQTCGGDWRNSIYKTGVTGGTSSGYLGCYFDESPGRRLIGDFRDFGKYLTQKTCIDYCKNKGYKYAGVQSSTQCFCGDHKPTSDDSRPETECSYKCTGDQSQTCGGDWRNSIYETGVTGESNSGYLGCYFDESARRLVGDFRDFGKYLTQKTCIDFCKGKIYKYAGVQSSTQCFCGDQRPTSDDSRPETECNYKCTGDQTEICGGDWRNSIYETTVRGGTKNVYLGCYFDENSGRRLIADYKDFGKYLTQQTCIDYCKDKGFTYAGVQSSTQCFCGNQKPTSDDSRPETECNYNCSGDQSQICGGDWRNSIYETKVEVATNYVYLGCYFDEHPARRLISNFKDFGKYLTQKTCIEYCKSKGNSYAGVQSSTQCFCGDRRPSPDDSRPERECNYKCTGDKSQICGGDWRNAVYETRVRGGSNYLGCYFDEHPARRLIGDYKDFGKDLTQHNCIDFCKSKGYPYAGAQYGHQCFCGDPRPNSDDLRPETECDSKCGGDQTQICGGSWRSSIYETGFEEALIIDRRHEYVGCFMDQEPDRAFNGYYIDLGDNSSPENCIKICKQKGFVYAGLQIRSQCFCGDEHPNRIKQTEEKDCKNKCIGDKRFNCGSDWRNNVYKTGNSDTLIIDSRYQYLGCYTDQEPRGLRGPVQDNGNQNSPERCVISCKERGYIYAGLQARTQCFCGDQDPKPQNKVDSKECKYKCPGDYKYVCGGDWRNTIYKTGHPGASVELAGYEYVGCYRDQAEPRLLRGEMLDYPETLTPSLCVGVCKKRGYVYAGLQSSSSCFCGDNEVTDKYKTNEEECHMKCTGDRTTICGGVWRLTLYRTGNKAPSVAKLADNDYVGCYTDQADPPLLQGHMQDFPETLTPQLCVALCKRKGYVFAGLQASSKCFCGDEELPNSAKVNDSSCSAKCTGDRSVFCGGAWRNTIYKTGNSGSSVANIGYLYMGCYSDLSYPRKLNGFTADFPETLTPQHCVTVCKQKGFQFAGLQRSFQCFCGNQFPSPVDKKPEAECNSKCSGNLTAICGGAWKNTIYSTASSNDENVENVCVTSVTRVNGKAACHNAVVFEENFNTLSFEKWDHNVQVAGEPDYEFVVYAADHINAYTEDGKLVIKPTTLSDTEVRSGNLQLENCTGNPEKDECGYQARSYLILPPVQSARLTTRKSFSFEYGKVEISAKLPLGDWLVPEIWLEPKNEVYGPGYTSGKIRIAMSRGNNDLKLDGKEIGCKQLQSGILMGIGDDIRGRTIIREISDGWHNNYHNYSVIWSPENMLFMVDGKMSSYLFPNSMEAVPAVVGFTQDVTPLWSSASRIAPFDSDFYLSLGITVGGVRNFPEKIINNGKPKPWKNLELKAMLKFWRDKNSWQRTWHDDTALLRVDSIKVTAL